MEAVFESAGSFGVFQLQTCLLPVLLYMLKPSVLLAPVFLMYYPEHRCRLPAESQWNHNDTFHSQSQHHREAIAQFIPLLGNSSELDSCNILRNGTSVACDSWVYDKSEFYETLTTELNLFCGGKSIATLISTCTFAGVSVGVFSAGYLADLIGRRRSLLCTLWLLTLAQAASQFAVSPTYTAIVRFLVGAGGLSSATVAYVAMFEFVGPAVRQHTVGAHAYGWVSGSLLSALNAFLTRSWRGFQLVVLIETALLLFLAHWQFFAPETPRWLAAQGRTEEAVKVVKRMLRQNKVADDLQREIVSQFREDLKNIDGNDNEEVLTLGKSLILLLKAPNLLVQYAITCMNWFILSAVYYGLAMGASNLPGNIYLTASLLSAAELPGNCFIHVTSSCIGRRTVHIGLISCSGLSLLGAAAVSFFAKEHEWLLVTTSIVGRAFICGAFTLIYVWTNEIYSTNMRLAGLSTSSMCARLGSLFAPLLGNIRDFIPGDLGASVPFLIFAVASSLSAVASCFVRETLNKPTPDSVTELILAKSSSSRNAQQTYKQQDNHEMMTDKPLLADGQKA